MRPLSALGKTIMAARRDIGLMAASLLATLGVAASSPVQADMVWNWSYSNADTKVAASGSLTTKDLSAGAYPITAVAGHWNGAAITALEPVKSCCSSPGWNSNVLVDGDPKLDKSGFAFSAGGGVKVNLFYKDGKYAYEIYNGPEVFGGVFVVTAGGAR